MKLMNLKLDDIKKEIKLNRDYLKHISIMSFLTVLPQFLIMQHFHHFSTLFFSIIFLIVLSQINKFVFVVFFIYINITSLILVHIKLHWGGEFSDRLGVALLSPLYEMKEYLISYLNKWDYLLIMYIFSLIFYMSYIFLKYSYKKQQKIIYVILSIILFLNLVKHEPFNMVSTYFQVKKRLNIVFIRKDFLKQEHLHTIKNNSPYNKIIIIQGEAANKHHLSLYGYHIKTTPFLDKLYKNNKLYKFNVIAPSNQTRYSIPMFFTKANVNNWRNNFASSHSIITDFKLAGYDTYWISNQGRVGKWDDYVTSVANEANHAIFFNKGDFSTAKSDIVMKNYLEHHKHNNLKELYVFHLIGSHAEYSKRYLLNHVIYKNPTSIIQEYDNTIFFTDYILKQIFKYFKNDKILIIYLSDHGEVVSKTKHGHGFLPPFKDEYEIPMVIYSNVKNSRILELKKLNNKKFNMENMNYIIKYITYLNNDLNISYSTKVFSVEPKHIFDYNKLDFYK